MSEHKVITYEPDNSLKKGYFSIVAEIINELRWNKWLIFQLCKRDLASIYKQSFLGFLWIFIIPLINVVVFLLLNRSGLFNFGEIVVPYPLYATIGMTFWQLFATGLLTCGSSLTQAGDMITKINFSKKALVIAPLGRAVLSFLIQLILVTILFIYYRISPSKGIFLIPIVIIPILFLTLGLGFIAALMNVVARDTGNILTLFIMFAMYLTPVLYAKPRLGILLKITNYNPMYYLLEMGRSLILGNVIYEWQGFAISVFVSFVIFIISLVIFHLTETRFAERI